MRKFIRITAFLLVFIMIFLVSCEIEENNAVQEPLDTDALAVIGTVEDFEQTTSLPESELQLEIPAKKRVAFTFDDGPHNVYTKRIVDELSKYGFHATFFVIGNRVDGSQYNGKAGLTYAYENGNEIGIHGYTHTAYYNKCSDEVYESELNNTEAAIKNVIKDIDVNLLRPVGGHITNERVEESEYSIILWNVDPEDWKNKYSSSDSEEVRQQKVDAMVDNVMTNVKDGSIVLMHDIYESTCDVVAILLERLANEGYEVVSVSELLGEKLAAGQKYSFR